MPLHCKNEQLEANGLMRCSNGEARGLSVILVKGESYTNSASIVSEYSTSATPFFTFST